MEYPPLSVNLQDSRSYRLFFRPIEEIPDLLKETGYTVGRCLVVTDEHVASNYLGVFERVLTGAGWSPRTIILPPGETTKSSEQLGRIYNSALQWGIDRKTPILALGGGVVGDLAGYAAATLLRGVPVVQIPTSLVAQIDSAIGGKTGINHPAGKNLIGAFHQPAFVCIDTRTLFTLPYREWTSGMAEMVKHALIADADLFDDLETDWTAVLDRQSDAVQRAVYRAAQIKTVVVSEDERETGKRAILNFGHTFGHAIERVAGYGTFTHGEAVALGMQAALYLSSRLNPDFPLDRAAGLVKRIPVPDGLNTLPVEALTDAMKTDKKVQAGTLRFVLLECIGRAYIAKGIAPELLEAAWNYAEKSRRPGRK